MSTETDTPDDAQTEETERTAIEGRDDIPERDALVQFRRNEGLTNEQIAEDHFPEFTPRDIGMFISMYGIKKGWKDEEYLRSQIDSGVTAEELSEQWPVTATTVETWMDRFDIEPNPVPDLYDDAIEALDALAEEVDDDDLADEYGELANKLNDDERSYFN